MFRTKKKIILASPVDGYVIPISQVDDPVFSGDILGRGVAVKPASEEAASPADARIGLMFDTGHAANLMTDDGVELLIHVGIDTVKLRGRHFSRLRASGDCVKKGDALMSFNIAAISGEGFDTSIAIVVCNPDAFSSIKFAAEGPVKKGEPLIFITK